MGGGWISVVQKHSGQGNRSKGLGADLHTIVVDNLP